MWHGYPEPYEAFLELTVVDRYYDNKALDELIDLGNARPEDLR